MVDNTAPAAAPAPSAAPASQAPSVPDGFVQVSKQDWDAAQRTRQQYDGLNQRWEKWKPTFGDHSNLDRLAEIAQKRGVKGDRIPALLDAMFNEVPDEPRADAPKGLTPEEIEQLVAKKTDHRFAEREWSEMSKAEKAAFKSVAKELAGDGAPDWRVQQIELALRGKATADLEDKPESRFYEPGHPLRDSRFRPYGPDEIATMKSWWADNETKAKAADAAAIGAAANKPQPRTPSTAAGNPTGQGAPKSEQARRFQDTPREELMGKLQQIRAKRGGGTVA